VQPPEGLGILYELVAQGARRTIVAYRDSAGRCPVLDFLASAGTKIEAKYGLKFRKLCDHGKLDGKEYHQMPVKRIKEVEGMSEFKDNPTKTRILCMNDNERARLVLLHAFGGKKEDDVDPQEIYVANRRRIDYLDRDRQMRNATTASSRKGTKQ
jgi:hypothetical protein